MEGYALKPVHYLLGWIVRPPTADGPRRVPGIPGWLSSCAVSFAVHLFALLALALLVLGPVRQRIPRVLTVLQAAENPEPFVMELAAASNSEDLNVSGQAFGIRTADVELPDAPPIDSPVPVAASVSTDSQAAPRADGPRLAELLLPSSTAAGGGFEGRHRAQRAGLLERFGGTPESEDAVARGLAWLAAHQRDDGSWRFDHRDGPCGGSCGDPGTVASTTGATGLALLPFLGAGETEKDSFYRPVVDRGLYYLASRLLLTPLGGDLQEGTMYAQGIAAMALSEGSAMTGDESLRPVAQHAVDFICRAQHEAGGWRYFPGQPGDTTVFGWQLMALKSAQLAGLEVPRETLQRAARFLDGVQADDGAAYGYMDAVKKPAPTAIGLLCRMYLGWSQDDPRLARGLDALRRPGPSRTDVYFNYYATQALHHHAGPGWDDWNRSVRERLIATQSRRGHEHGSWHFVDEHGKSGGRLYTTAMCVMILEVYYRYMPLYTERAVEGR